MLCIMGVDDNQGAVHLRENAEASLDSKYVDIRRNFSERINFRRRCFRTGCTARVNAFGIFDQAFHKWFVCVPL